MFAKIKKFPFIELILIVLTNICSWGVLSVGILYFIFYEAIPKTEIRLLYIILLFTCVIFPLILYFTLLYLSRNKIFLRLFIRLNRNNITKILFCLFYFLISPLQLYTTCSYYYDFHLLQEFFFGGIFSSIINYMYSLAIPLSLFFIFEPFITKLVNKHCKNHPNSKSWLKKNYDLRMEIQD